MSTDARLSTGLPGHPKTKKLIRRLGPQAGWSLVCLILWARGNRPDGDLAGMTAEDIELAADWAGENDALVRELASVGFLDGEEGSYRMHDWADHQPWAAGSDMRSLKARWNAVKRHHGVHEADRQVPEYAAIRAASTESDATGTKSDAASTASSTDAAVRAASSSNAPSPSPSPYPSPRAEEQSSLRSDSSAPLALTSDPPAPADLKSRQAARIQQIATDAQEAYNRILARPHGLLPACAVLNRPRIKAVEKALPTVRAICRKLYGNDRIVPEFWQALFETAADDEFHSGRKQGGPGHESWKPDFEYLVRETTIAKLFDRAMSEGVEAAA